MANRTTTVQRGALLVCTCRPAVDVETHLAHGQLKKRGIHRLRSNEDGQQVDSDFDSAGKTAKRDKRPADECQRRQRSRHRLWYVHADSSGGGASFRSLSL